MSDETERDMRVLLRLSGVTLPEERIPVMLESYRRWRIVARLLDEPLDYAAEPAVVFHPAPGVK